MNNETISGFEPFDASNWELAAERLWANFEARGIAEETPADVDILKVRNIPATPPYRAGESDTP